MFKRETEWLAGLLQKEPSDALSPLLNIGSSTRELRERIQPWTEALLFAPLSARGVKVVHLDTREGDGIDIKADILSDADLTRVKAVGAKAVLCCNILEHVTEPAKLARACIDIVGPGGLIFVTVPYSYPRHRDPIDTLYRPSPEELARLFAGTHMDKGEIIDVGEGWSERVFASGHYRPAAGG